MPFALVVLMIGAFAFGTDGFVLAGMLPSLSHDLGVSVSAAGQLVTVYSLTSAVAAPVFGMMTASWRRRDALLAGIWLLVVGNAVTALSAGLALALAGRAIAGAGTAMFMMNASIASTELVPPERHGRASAWLQSGMTIAIVTSVPMGAWLGSVTSWRWTLAVNTALGVLVAAGVRAWLPRGHGIPLTGLRERLGPLRDRDVLNMLASSLTIRVAYHAPYTYIGVLLADTTHGDDARLPLLLLVLGAAAIPGTLAAGYLIDKFGARAVLLAAIAAFALDLVLQPLATTTFVGTIVVLAVWGFAGWMIGLPQRHTLVGLAPETCPFRGRVDLRFCHSVSRRVI